MALIGAHVCQGSAQLQTPSYGTAIVAHMSCVLRIFHSGQVLLHHVDIATKTVAGQDDRIARQLADAAIGL